ncbi:hypothetical protein HDA32_002234 [Spinactinospora alkalitolerans]|uniref:Uncharacterized protein n=1 Tax=Spinactinospora alkalitolerans TaxID=687207 RepID=A0A852TYP9_9ACTN|nr:hypothetical protein [Spinactinospora alkalitolerans]NYE47114.1 hypothetical protein [Spinactinospora alkalitolerans]
MNGFRLVMGIGAGAALTALAIAAFLPRRQRRAAPSPPRTQAGNLVPVGGPESR